MGIVIDEQKCQGCGTEEEPPCVKYCPGNLIKLKQDSGSRDSGSRKREIKFRSSRDCWDCMVCIKVCPHNALQTRLPYQLASYKASLSPRVRGNKIIWEAENINGHREVFESRISAD